MKSLWLYLHGFRRIAPWRWSKFGTGTVRLTSGLWYWHRDGHNSPYPGHGPHDNPKAAAEALISTTIRNQ